MPLASRQRWKDHLALKMVICAVLTTTAWYKDSSCSTQAILCQNEVSNHWNHFQAKSIKATVNQLTREQLGAQQSLLPESDAAGRALLGERIAAIDLRLARYDAERKELEAAATAKEKERDRLLLHSTAFGKAMMLLQIAVVLGSVASLLDKRNLYYLGLVLASGGCLYFVNGWMLLF